jgi:transglutaminase-like putative cysteine protease
MADPTSPALDEASRRWALLVAAVCLAPLLLQLPGPTALAIAATAVVITALSWRRPLSNLLRGVLAVAIVVAVSAQFRFEFGRDTGCALLGAMLALKPSETASLRDARSLVGFALFAPFSTFLLDQGPLSLALGLAGAMLARGALQRLAAVEGGMPAAGIVRPLRHALRLLLLGLPLALAIFWLFPRIATPLWGVPGRAQAKVGLSDSMSPGDWVDLLADDSVAARARFVGATPPKSAMYWRGPVLWDFDGRTWRRGRDADTRPPSFVPSATRWTYTLDLEPTDRRQLVALDLPLAVPDGVRASSDFSLYSARPLAALTRWTLTSAVPATFDATLASAQRRRALALPAGFDPRTVALGRGLRAKLGDDRRIVRYALDWIHRDFAYSISAPVLGRDAMDDFLFRTRTGYCEHFAGAFTLLMRAAGIPTRVVTGYVGGRWNRLGGYWMIRRMDAHAWTEVWLPGRGWVRVDPTAAVAPERIYDTVDDVLPDVGGVFETLQGPGGLAQVGDWLRQNWNDMVLGFDADRQSRLFSPLGLRRIDATQLALLFGAVASLALGLMVWLGLRGPRERDPVLRAWHRLDRRYARRGLARAPHEPPMAWAERLTKADAPNVAELRDLAARFTLARYASAVADGASARGLVRDLRRHRPS